MRSQNYFTIKYDFPLQKKVSKYATGIFKQKNITTHLEYLRILYAQSVFGLLLIIITQARIQGGHGSDGLPQMSRNKTKKKLYYYMSSNDKNYIIFIAIMH
jgi:hypothetical protein